MSRYGDMDMFPVKIHVPIIMTVSVSMAFKKFKLLSDKDAPALAKGFFDVPQGYDMAEPKLPNKSKVGVVC